MQGSLENKPPPVQDSPSKAEPVEVLLPDGPPPVGNRGRFRRGDPRINREGRPRSKAGSAEGDASAVRAACADRVMLLVVPGPDLVWRLRRQNSPWFPNIPEGAEIVGCAHLAARDAVALILRSETFRRVAKGAPIPEFEPRPIGLHWRRRG